MTPGERWLWAYLSDEDVAEQRGFSVFRSIRRSRVNGLNLVTYDRLLTPREWGVIKRQRAAKLRRTARK